jgi:Na+-transporting NADH:ubiquinone oxidoreductase subunit C
MKNKYSYTIGFVLLVSVVFSAVLAAVNAFYLPAIQKNEELADKRSVLYTLGLENKGDREQVEKIFQENVQEEKIAGLDFFVRLNEQNEAMAYSIPFMGSGLWGSIQGYLAFSSDFTQIYGIDFTSHSETPGLGGRIDEAWFKDQFRGLSLDLGSTLSYKRDGEGDIDAITGATLTSGSVMDIVNNLTNKVLEGLEPLSKGEENKNLTLDNFYEEEGVYAEPYDGLVQPGSVPMDNEEEEVE